MANDSKLPKGRLGRLRRLAGVGLRVGADQIRKRSEGVAAEKAAEVLGELRGVAAKVGQMAGYIDGVVPEQQRDSYEKWMKKLMDQAPRSGPEAVRAQIEGELGGSVDEHFASFDFEPVASASIGQVHKAELRDGRIVAVKVQHPGVDKAMESDLKNASLIERPFRMFAGAKFESKRILEEIRARFREELDYELEASRQQAMIDVHAGDPDIIIPKIVDTHSAKRVLTMDWVEGMRFDEARQQPDAIRRKYAETMWRFVYKGTLIGGLFNADPHPGNFLFQPDGRVTFLDFGCVQATEQHKRDAGIATHLAACRGDEAAFYAAACDMLELKGGSYEKVAIDYVRNAFEPQFKSPYRITRDYVASLASGIKGAFDAAKTAKDGSYVPFAPGIFFLNRLQFGFFSVLARLDVEVDYAACELAFLAPAEPEQC